MYAYKTNIGLLSENTTTYIPVTEFILFSNGILYNVFVIIVMLCPLLNQNEDLLYNQHFIPGTAPLELKIGVHVIDIDIDIIR